MNPQQPGPVSQQPQLPPQPPQQPYQAPLQPQEPFRGVPEQQYGTPQPAPGQQPYEFIINPTKVKVRRSLVPGGSLLSRVALIGGAAVVVIILLVIVSSLFGHKSSNLVPLVAVAQDQTELIRVASLGSNQANSQSAQNSGISTQLSITSAKQALVAYLATNGKKVTPKELSLKLDKRTDTQLSAATGASNFDSVYIGILQTQLTAYARDLKAAYATNPGAKGDALLKSQYNGAQLLLTQSKQQ